MANRKSFLLRIPPDLHAELERWAQGELRSLNAQIEFLLRRAVQERRRRAGPAPQDEASSAGSADGPRAPEDSS